MNEFFILAEITILVIFYIWIMHTWTIIYTEYKTRQNKPNSLSSEDDINIK